MLIASEMLKETVISVPRRIAKSYLLALAQRLTDDLQVLQRVLGAHLHPFRCCQLAIKPLSLESRHEAPYPVHYLKRFPRVKAGRALHSIYGHFPLIHAEQRIYQPIGNALGATPHNIEPELLKSLNVPLNRFALSLHTPHRQPLNKLVNGYAMISIRLFE